MVMGELKMETEVAIIGAGPGGYVAALRAADLGKEVTLIDERDRPGGVCLIEGCIPSKTLIHAVTLTEALKGGKKFGLTFENLQINHNTLREHTEEVVEGLTSSIKKLLIRRGVEIIKGRASFVSDHEIQIKGSDVAGVTFQHAIIATGSRPKSIPGTEDLDLWDSAKALKLPTIPSSLIVVGGGYIGMELGSVYAGLGSKVTLVHSRPNLIKSADDDLVRVMLKSTERRFEKIITDNRVASITKESGLFKVLLKDGTELLGDNVFVSIGRKPNSDKIGLENTSVEVSEDGLIKVDEQCRTTVPHIFAIGDVVPGPQLAHKASREAKVAAEVIVGENSAFDNRAVPAVVFTDPEIAWVGLTEREAIENKEKVAIGRFPLKALGRARTLGREDGMVKIIYSPESQLVLGVGIVSPDASDLIAEATLAIEMGAVLEDMMVTIHPHPTLSEAIQEAAEVAAGTAVHI